MKIRLIRLKLNGGGWGVAGCRRVKEDDQGVENLFLI